MDRELGFLYHNIQSMPSPYGDNTAHSFGCFGRHKYVA